MTDQPIDLGPLYVLLDRVESGDFYSDYDNDTALLSAAWTTYFAVSRSQDTRS